MGFKRLHIIVNPAAGQDHPFLQIFNTAFREAGIDWDIYITKEFGDATRLAQEAVKAGADVVAAFGGDGTVMEVATGLRGSKVPLAIFPGGTGNIMAVELGIPLDLPGAVALVCGMGAPRTVDMGQSDEHLFILRATIGLSAEIMKEARREAKNRLGNLEYLLAAMRALPNIQSSVYRLNLDGEQKEVEGVMCIIANSGNLGRTGWSLTQNVNVSDGLLDVFVIRSVDLGTLLTVAANAAGWREPDYHWQVKQVSVEADPPQNVDCDGDVIGQTPFKAHVIPDAVQVIVPKLPEPAA